ncbi:MAG: hypothetical protein H6736_21660 [Alphaproteobacteria bacterium]|nr:hypothetical protein [Alphaproteobacteria bacterium]
MLAWLAVALGATCDTTSPEALEARVEEAERAFGDLASDRFLELTASLAQDVACLEGTVTPTMAAHFHRAFGLRAYLGRQEGDTRAAFASARLADPGYVFPFWLLPEQHALRQLYAESEPDPAVLPVLPPREGSLFMDGVASTERPQLRPTLVQVLDADGAVQASAWLRATDAMPPYTPTRPVLPPLVGNLRAFRTVLLTTSVASAAVAAGTYGVAGLANARFQGASDRDTLLGSRRLANSMVGTSAVGLGVSVTTFTGALLVGRL